MVYHVEPRANALCFLDVPPDGSSMQVTHDPTATCSTPSLVLVQSNVVPQALVHTGCSATTAYER